MSRIQQLDSQIANMIAAGEVVERPMGVIKELVENAIDAGSTRIVVTIEGGGITKLKVEDNGCGMDKEDALMAFQRHATSKIRVQNDLWNIQTLGFRGEALPSIASVSKLTLATSDGNDATRVIMEYGENTVYEPYPCPNGTSITVEGLFYRTPARLKHLRSANYEASLIQNVIASFALAHPEIAFRLINEGRDAFRSTGNNNLLEVIYLVFGRGPAENAIELDFEDFDYHVTGYAIKPMMNRSSRTGMHVFLNQRMVRENRLYQAIQQGYGTFMPNGRYPMVVMNITMDPHILDVNVHPSKWEVRLSKQTQLEYLIQDGIYKALNQRTVVPEVKGEEVVQTYYQPVSFPKEDLMPKEEKVMVIPQEMIQEVKEKKVDIQEEIKQDEEILLEIQEKTQVKQEVKEELPAYDDVLPFPAYTIIGQYQSRYILLQVDNGLCLVNQSRANKRIQYEQMLEQLQNQITMRQLLIPITIHSSSDMCNRVDEINTSVESLGVVFEVFGLDTFVVRQIPSWIPEGEEESILNDILDYIKTERKTGNIVKETIVQRLSNRRDRVNDHLSIEQMQAMIQSLAKCSNPYVTPNGDPILVVIEDKVLLKEFS